MNWLKNFIAKRSRCDFIQMWFVIRPYLDKNSTYLVAITCRNLYNGEKAPISLCNHAAKINSVNLLKYAIMLGCPCTIYTSIMAAGSLECLKYLYDHSYPVSIYVYKEAAKLRALDCMKLIYHFNGDMWVFAYRYYENINMLENSAKFAKDGAVKIFDRHIDKFKK